MLPRGLAVKIKKRNVFVSGEFGDFLCGLLFVGIDINTGVFAHR